MNVLRRPAGRARTWLGMCLMEAGMRLMGIELGGASAEEEVKTRVSTPPEGTTPLGANAGITPKGAQMLRRPPIALARREEPEGPLQGSIEAQRLGDG